MIHLGQKMPCNVDEKAHILCFGWCIYNVYKFIHTHPLIYTFAHFHLLGVFTSQ